MSLRTLLPHLPSWGSELTAKPKVGVKEDWMSKMMTNIYIPFHLPSREKQLEDELTLPGRSKRKKISYWDRKEPPSLVESRYIQSTFINA